MKAIFNNVQRNCFCQSSINVFLFFAGNCFVLWNNISRPVDDQFRYSPHLSAWYGLDVVRRNEMLIVWSGLVTVLLTIPLIHEIVFDSILTAFKTFWKLFADFCLNRPIKTWELSRAEMLKCLIHHSHSWEFQKSQPADVWNQRRVVAVWLAIWNGSHQKLSKRCQRLVKN